MRKLCTFAAVLAMAFGAAASWYWPFGSSDDDAPAPVRRLSELMEPASRLIDEASDLASEGKSQEAVEKYREALAELDRIEAENPERVASPEFSSVRNKRAYVNAAIDSVLLEQVKANAKAVAVSDTTALEKRLAEEKAKASGGGAKPSAEAEETPAAKPAEAKTAQEPVAKKPEARPAQKPVAAKRPVPQTPARPRSRREQAIADIAAGDYAAAELQIMEMLAEKPNSAMALNLKASMESAQGKYKEAERTLDQAITSNPRSYYAYYNMASLLLEVNPAAKAMAGKYYRAGREVGGPPDPQLEAALK